MTADGLVPVVLYNAVHNDMMSHNSFIMSRLVQQNYEKVMTLQVRVPIWWCHRELCDDYHCLMAARLLQSAICISPQVQVTCLYHCIRTQSLCDSHNLIATAIELNL